MASGLFLVGSSHSFSRQKLLPPTPTLKSPSSSSTIKFKTRPFQFDILQSQSCSVARSIGANLSVPLISPHDQWGNWTSLFAAAAFGIWSERTKIGKTVSGSMVTILVCLAARNLGILSGDAAAYGVVLQFLLPLAVPLLLFRADLRRVINSTGALLLPFLLGSVATTIGTVVAYLLVPMRSLGQDSWKIAAALMGRHIGGAVNYVAISDALDDGMSTTSESGDKLPVLQMASSLAVSFAICKAATFFTGYFGIQGGILPVATAIAVTFATVFPKPFATLAPSGEAMAVILIQVFFGVIGASGSIWSVMNTAPSIFLFALVQIGVHLAVILGLGRLFSFDLKLLLIASNANVGGPTTACGMATAKGWDSLIVPGILAAFEGQIQNTHKSNNACNCKARRCKNIYYKDTWTPKLDSKLNSTYFREQGTNLLLFTFPFMFIGALGCVYLHLSQKNAQKSPPLSGVVNGAAHGRLSFLKRPLLVMSPIGIVTSMELTFSAMFVALLIWSLSNYLHTSFGHLYMDKEGEKM
ncbi:hypothetical protein SESBI_42052 [Sesbania bispinosa]|nr:hypothetical protein SESBI_42052 [Sesbania bispinosa]